MPTTSSLCPPATARPTTRSRISAVARLYRLATVRPTISRRCITTTARPTTRRPTVPTISRPTTSSPRTPATSRPTTTTVMPPISSLLRQDPRVAVKCMDVGTPCKAISRALKLQLGSSLPYSQRCRLSQWIRSYYLNDTDVHNAVCRCSTPNKYQFSIGTKILCANLQYSSVFRCYKSQRSALRISCGQQSYVSCSDSCANTFTNQLCESIEADTRSILQAGRIRTPPRKKREVIDTCPATLPQKDICRSITGKLPQVYCNSKLKGPQ